MSNEPGDALDEVRAVEERLATTNVLMAEWAACKLENTPSLVERLEQMGYQVRGKSREAVEEVLKNPPSRPTA